MESIKRQGLTAGKQNPVHLSPDQATVVKVSQRHSRPIVLTVPAGKMNTAGFVFYHSANGVWLTEKVPVEYLVSPAEENTFYDTQTIDHPITPPPA